MATGHKLRQLEAIKASVLTLSDEEIADLELEQAAARQAPEPKAVAQIQVALGHAGDLEWASDLVGEVATAINERGMPRPSADVIMNAAWAVLGSDHVEQSIWLALYEPFGNVWTRHRPDDPEPFPSGG